MADNKAKHKKECNNVRTFLKTYVKGTFSCCPIKEGKEKRPDCYIPKLKMLVEVKGIHDTEANRKLAQWSKIIGKIRYFVNSHPDIKKIKGFYSINTPPLFKFPKGRVKYEKAASEIIVAVLGGAKKITIKNVKFEIKKISDDGKGIYFGAIGGCGFVNPAGTIYQNISTKIAIANEQLSYDYEKKVEKRILLLVSHYHFANKVDEVIKGISFGYKAILASENINEIWLQISTEKKDSEHTLLYDKDFFKQYEKGKISPSKTNTGLYQRWYYALLEMGDRHKDKLFKGLKIFLKRNKPYEVFDDKFKRQEMVHLGEWLIGNQRWDDAIWLVEKFITDPDPTRPDKYVGEPIFNYHEKILSGEDTRVITTVLGYLAWVIQKFTVSKKYIKQALDFTEKLLAHKNFYVKKQAMVPLTQISAKRQWLDGYGVRPYRRSYKRFHDLVFNLLELLSTNSNLKFIAEGMVDVFQYYKDLSTEEALQVLNALKVTSRSASLFIYFGIYRKNHFKGMGIKFNGVKLNKNLIDVMNSRGEIERCLQSSFAWIFRDILEDDPKEFKKLKFYLDLLFEAPYERRLYQNTQYFLQKWVEKKPMQCIIWFEKMLDNMITEVKNKDHIDIWVDSTEEVLSMVARKRPDDLVKYMEKLIELWIKGAFIGDIKTLFYTYKLVADRKKQARIKKIFRRWYETMKRMNPRLKNVEW